MPATNSVEIELSSLAVATGTACTAEFKKTNGPGNVTVKQDGDISFAGNSSAVGISWKLNNSAKNAGWAFKSPAFTYEAAVFSVQTSTDTTVTVTDELNAWKYTLHLTFGKKDYSIDPKIINR